MARTEAAKAIEAILMVAQEPVEPHLLAQLLEVAPAIVEELCDHLAATYRGDDRGFELVRVAGGYRFQSRADLAPYVERFVLEGQSSRLSAAALETLAIVAYKQPISRAQVASIRGVNVDGVMRTLQQRGYLVETGRDPGPGQAVLFGTSREFLERLGLDSLDDLPPIAELFPDAAVMEALERGLRVEPAEGLGTGDGDGPRGPVDPGVGTDDDHPGAEVPAPERPDPVGGIDEDAHAGAPAIEEQPEDEPVEIALVDLDAPVEDIPVPSWALDEPLDGPHHEDPVMGPQDGSEADRRPADDTNDPYDRSDPAET